MSVLRKPPELRQRQRRSGPRPSPTGLRYGRLHFTLEEEKVRVRDPGLGSDPPRGPWVQEEALVSLQPHHRSLSLSLYKWINVYVVVCMCNKCVYVYIFYVCISGFACKLTWWLTCVFWFFFFGGVVFGWWESGGK